MNRLLMFSATAALATVVAGPGMADVKSGLQKGEHASAFNVLDCTGPAKGRKLCYR